MGMEGPRRISPLQQEADLTDNLAGRHDRQGTWGDGDDDGWWSVIAATSVVGRDDTAQASNSEEADHGEVDLVGVENGAELIDPHAIIIVPGGRDGVTAGHKGSNAGGGHKGGAGKQLGGRGQETRHEAILVGGADEVVEVDELSLLHILSRRSQDDCLCRCVCLNRHLGGCLLHRHLCGHTHARVRVRIRVCDQWESSRVLRLLLLVKLVHRHRGRRRQRLGLWTRGYSFLLGLGLGAEAMRYVTRRLYCSCSGSP